MGTKQRLEDGWHKVVVQCTLHNSRNFQWRGKFTLWNRWYTWDGHNVVQAHAFFTQAPLPTFPRTQGIPHRGWLLLPRASGSTLPRSNVSLDTFKHCNKYETTCSMHRITWFVFQATKKKKNTCVSSWPKQRLGFGLPFRSLSIGWIVRSSVPIESKEKGIRQGTVRILRR